MFSNSVRDFIHWRQMHEINIAFLFKRKIHRHYWKPLTVSCILILLPNSCYKVNPRHLPQFPTWLLGSLLLTRGSALQRWPSLRSASLLATRTWHCTQCSFTGQVLSILACFPCVFPRRLHLQQTSINLAVTCSFHSPKGPDSSQVNEQTNSSFWVSHKSMENVPHTVLLEFKGRTRKNN